MIRYAVLGAIPAVGGRCAPEPDLIEVVHAVGGAAAIREQLVAGTGGGHGWHRAEPGRQVTLQLGIQ